MNPLSDNFRKQLDFLIEIDKVKSIYRKSKTFSGEKYENDAEHTWHICLMVLVLKEYANETIDVLRVLKMLLIHDIVEINAGDTFLYAENRNEVFEKEKHAAERIFGLLPSSQCQEFMELWLEFEAKQTPEAKFAGSVDRLQPMLSNYLNQGITWRENLVNAPMIYRKNEVINEGSEALWRYAQLLIKSAKEKEYIE